MTTMILLQIMYFYRKTTPRKEIEMCRVVEKRGYYLLSKGQKCSELFCASSELQIIGGVEYEQSRALTCFISHLAPLMNWRESILIESTKVGMVINCFYLSGSV